MRKLKQLLVVALLTVSQSACDRTPAQTSFGVEGTTLNCVGENCEIMFFVDNQMPHATKIRYRAVLSNARDEVVMELSDVITAAALEKTRVSRSVSVAGRPERLRVTVTTLNGQ